MSILKWKIRFKGILERKPHVLLIFHVSTIDAFVVRLLNVLCQMPYTSWSSGLRWAVATRVALNERRYIGSAKLSEVQSIAPIVWKLNWLRPNLDAYASAAIEIEMTRRFYTLQLSIYTVALNRFLPVCFLNQQRQLRDGGHP